MSKRPCTCERCDPAPGVAYTLDQCRRCWKFHHDDEAHRAWGGLGLNGQPRRLPCKLRGPQTNSITCSSCPGNVELKVFHCDRYNACTVAKQIPGVPCCATCHDYDPDTYSLVAPGGTQDMGSGKERGRCPKKSWEYELAITIAHLDTLEVLKAGIDLWRAQTVQPYFLIVDTGSHPSVCEELEKLRSCDLEIHYLRGHSWIQSSAPISTALDMAMALCRSDYLFCTHSDVFPRRRDLLEWLLGQTNAEQPVVGYGMSDRSWITDQWQKCVGHACLMLHMPRLRQAGVIWNMEHNYHLLGWDYSKPVAAWPDTESGFSMDCYGKGVPIHLIGRETNDLRQKDDNIDHFRSWTASMVYSEVSKRGQRQHQMINALAEARERLAIWSKQLGGRH